jgi:hypothetical protein
MGVDQRELRTERRQTRTKARFEERCKMCTQSIALQPGD